MKARRLTVAQAGDARRLFHYTTCRRLSGILDAGEIYQATSDITPDEIPAVWLSTAKEWEHTATKTIMDNGTPRRATLQEMVEADGGLARLEIDPSAVNLIYPVNLRKVLRIPKLMFAALVSVAHEDGASASEWRAVAAPIPINAVVNIEIAISTAPIMWTNLADL